jgi:hypothetical protein
MPTATATRKLPVHKFRMHCHAVLMGRPNKDFSQLEVIHNRTTHLWDCYRVSPRADRNIDRIDHSTFLPWLVYPGHRGLTLAGVKVQPTTPPGTMSFRASVSRLGDGQLSIYVRRNLKADKRFLYVDLDLPHGLILPEGLDRFAKVEGLAIATDTPKKWQLLSINLAGGAK